MFEWELGLVVEWEFTKVRSFAFDYDYNLMFFLHLYVTGLIEFKAKCLDSTSPIFFHDPIQIHTRASERFLFVFFLFPQWIERTPLTRAFRYLILTVSSHHLPPIFSHTSSLSAQPLAFLLILLLLLVPLLRSV